MEIILRGQSLWKYVENPSTKTSKINREQHIEHHRDKSDDRLNESNEKENQRCDLALPYMMTTISQNCKDALHKMRCPAEVWTKL